MPRYGSFELVLAFILLMQIMLKENEHDIYDQYGVEDVIVAIKC